jgi:metal-sulfur cluster biosynthetic enzyme
MPRYPATIAPLDPDVLDCLLEVMDPEVGLSIVDLGLVYQATRGNDGIAVALTLTTRACPLGEMIVEDARTPGAAVPRCAMGRRHLGLESAVEPGPHHGPGT